MNDLMQQLMITLIASLLPTLVAGGALVIGVRNMRAVKEVRELLIAGAHREGVAEGRAQGAAIAKDLALKQADKDVAAAERS